MAYKQEPSTFLIKKKIKWGEFQTLSGYINFSFDHLLRKTKAKLIHSGSVIILLTYEHN